MFQQFNSAVIGWDKGGNVICFGWQVTLYDPVWHMSYCSSEARLQTAIFHLPNFTSLLKILSLVLFHFFLTLVLCGKLNRLLRAFLISILHWQITISYNIVNSHSTLDIRAAQFTFHINLPIYFRQIDSHKSFRKNIGVLELLNSWFASICGSVLSRSTVYEHSRTCDCTLMVW